MAKTLPKIGARPTETSADSWINGDTGTSKTRNAETQKPAEEATARLTLDIPRGLHAEIKAQCARRGTKMVVEITELLEAHYRPEIQKTGNL
ncbi:hypothetical protein P5V93_24355 [Mycobacteroides abscessus subsp. abscessus]|uniref:hypothetical protein n=1 Tax=Mycobacteroides abscessus TaxID=36809 RepID=UPI0009269067|nr:hypothetical protein [Mycobacteroides abscessus]MBN7550241.1 hypothetical protein [Mycobacteroides abscessus subsp. abscessus]MDO3287645.1 hypothetical protein [Mycobacteroides abscessus subsp. abscessus]QSM72221.1 hypothetical protein IN837_24310 [Mycobacteroides abscessus subsp. abscessus]SHQ66827.1 Uncharacterised protein [Mycobacteroides abscessus subsp. abscessus]SHR24601.1 Uncharacterised protein [Mycobacteroides abscessus subsp. abscessus]